MHQSGTHWLKHIVACALAHRFGIPDPKYNHANDIFGGPREPVLYPEIPRLVSSHSNPHPIIVSNLIHSLFNLPCYVLLIRDIRYSLLSNYAKWSHTYRVSFSTYLRGGTDHINYNSDIWWAVRFLNNWGAVYKNIPSRVMIVRYEELLKNPRQEVDRIDKFWNLGLEASDIDYGIKQSVKSKMAQKDDPSRPKGAVREALDNGLETFSSEDKLYFEKVCSIYLRFPAGYKYSSW